MKVLRHLGLIVALIVCSASGSFAQVANNELKLSIVVDQTDLHPSKVSKMHASITWGTVPHARADSFRLVSFRLTKSDLKTNRYTRGDCFEGRYGFPEPPTLRSGELLEFDVDLSELYWYDLVLSSHNFRGPKNMAETIQPGSYVLSMSMAFPADYSKKIPLEVRTTSNVVLVQVK